MKKRTKGGWLKKISVALMVFAIVVLALVAIAFSCAEIKEGGSCDFCQRIGLGFSQI